MNTGERKRLEDMTLREMVDGQLNLLQELLEDRKSKTLGDVWEKLQDLVVYNNAMHRLIRRF
jgi:hypothetical protein